MSSSGTGKHQLLGGTSVPVVRKKPRVRPIAKPQKRRANTVLPRKPDSSGTASVNNGGTRLAGGVNGTKQASGKDTSMPGPIDGTDKPLKDGAISDDGQTGSIHSTTRTTMDPPPPRQQNIVSPHPPIVSRSMSRPKRQISSLKKGTKGSSISIGSSMKRPQEAGLNLRQLQSPKDNSTNDTTKTVDDESITPSTASTDTAIVSRSNLNSDFIAYQYLGMLDPKWNIPPPKANERSMKDFCSKFKLPKEAREAQAAKRKEERDADLNNNGANGPNNVQTRSTNNGNANVTKTDLDKDADDSSQSGPMVEIVNGEIVISQSSMIVGSRKTIEEVDRELEGQVVVEDSAGLEATYNSFTNREKSLKWTHNETKQFYLALRQCGTDFSMMENYFDGSTNLLGSASSNSPIIRKRTRKQLKSKYKIENRKNPKLIDMALNPSKQLPLDLNVFSDMNLEISTLPVSSSDSTDITSTSPPPTASQTTNDISTATTTSMKPNAIITNKEAVSTTVETSNTMEMSSSLINSAQEKDDDQSLSQNQDSSSSLKSTKATTFTTNTNQESTAQSSQIEIDEPTAKDTTASTLNPPNNGPNKKTKDTSNKFTNADTAPLALVPNAGKPKQKRPKFRARPGPKPKSKNRRKA